MNATRRTVFKTAPLWAAALPTPGGARAATNDTLNFVPVADFTVMDPYFALPDVTAMHCNLVYDTLWGIDATLRPQVQMLESAVLDPDGRRWLLTLRDGLMFHDNTPVTADDVVASIRKWGTRDTLGSALMQATTALDAVSDRAVELRLQHPFPLLPIALGKPATFCCYIMPRRIAEMAGAGKAIEPIGSGPYRYVASERLVGSRFVYERFDAYRPRSEQLSYLAGGKVPYFRRIHGTVIPDAATAAASLQQGEVDWLSDVSADLAPLLRRDRKITVQVQDLIGGDLIMRFNALWPPFDNPAIRRAVLPAINQSEFMSAIAGDDRTLWRDHVGAFSVGKPMSTDTGVEVMAGDVGRARRMLHDAGYKGERVVMLSASDYPSLSAAAELAADLLKRIGFNVDLQNMDYGTMMQRRENRASPASSGWNVFFAWFSGYNRYIPPTHLGLSSSFPGWVKNDEIATLQQKWIEAPDLAAEQAIARQIQVLVWRDVPFVPLGTYFPITAYKAGLTGVPTSAPLFFGVRWA